MTTGDLSTQGLALVAGVLLLSGVLLVWRRPLWTGVRLLVLQGAALGALVATIAWADGLAELLLLALLVVALKAVGLPWVIGRLVGRTPGIDSGALLGPVPTLLIVAALTTLAYLVSRPMARGSGFGAGAVAVGMALVLYGFLLLVTRRHAVSQLMGFLMLDNGIAAVAFLTSGGLPLVVELGVLLDVLLVVLVLQVLASRMISAFGGIDLDDLTELRD